MADALEVAPEIAFHLDGHPVLEQVFLLQQELFGQGADALLGVLAIRRAAEIQVRVHEPVLALRAFAGRVVLEKLHTWHRIWGTAPRRWRRASSRAYLVRGIS
jgi:hypothetical protein